MKNKLALVIAAMVIAGSVQVGLADPWDNYDFGKGNLENWDVLENGDNMEIVRDFEAKGGFYYRAKDVNQHAVIASPKFTIKEKHGILVIRYFRSGSTDCNLWLYIAGVDPVLLAGTSEAPTEKFLTKEFDLSSYIGRTAYVVLEGGAVMLDYLKLQERYGSFSKLTHFGGANHKRKLSISPKGILYSGGYGLRAYDIVSEKKIWEFQGKNTTLSVGEWETSYPVIDDDGNIYFASMQGIIIAVDKKGNELWNFHMPDASPLASTPAIGKNGMLYVLSLRANVYALDKRTGKMIWVFREGPFNHSAAYWPLAIASDGTIFYGVDPSIEWKGDNTFFALDGQTGIKIWGSGDSGRGTSPVINHNGSVFANSGSGISALDSKTGKELWATRGLSPRISNDGNKIFLQSNGTVALDAITGEKIWENKEIGSNDMIVCNNGSIFGVANNNLFCLSQNTGVKHWEIKSDVELSPPVIGIDGSIYMTGSDYFVYRVKTSSTGDPISPWPMLGQNAQRTSRAPSFGDQQLALTSATIFKGSLIDIDINFSGRGYTYPPDVRVVGGGGNGAMAKAFVSDGIVTDIIILNPGQGYTSAPSIEIDWPPFPPKQAFATPQITNGFLTGFNTEDPGSGYQNVPTVKIINENGSGAIAEAVLDKSKVVEIKVINPGSGYDSDAIVVIDPPPYPPSRASGEATVVNGFVISLTVTNEGRGYSSPPRVEIIGEGGSGAEVIAILEDGLVVGLNLLSAGSGYSNDTEVIIAPPEGFEQSFQIEELFIRPAVELEFLTLESKIYQLQWSTDLNNWNDDEQPFGGIGGLTSIFKSAGADKVYWRLKVTD